MLPGEKQSDGAGDNSLLAELEGQMDSKIKAQEERQQKPAPGAVVEGAPDNCEDYFLIAQTAVKIGLAIKYPHHSDRFFQVRGIDLYYKCLNSRIPFHQVSGGLRGGDDDGLIDERCTQWHNWISKTLQEMIKGEAKPAAIMQRKDPDKDKKKSFFGSFFGGD